MSARVLFTDNRFSVVVVVIRVLVVASCHKNGADKRTQRMQETRTNFDELYRKRTWTSECYLPANQTRSSKHTHWQCDPICPRDRAACNPVRPPLPPPPPFIVTNCIVIQFSAEIVFCLFPIIIVNECCTQIGSASARPVNTFEGKLIQASQNRKIGRERGPSTAVECSCP